MGSARAIVVDLSDGGRKATLRPFDNDPEFTAVWAELCLTGKWKRTEAEGAAS
jgi:hypothetical protein